MLLLSPISEENLLGRTFFEVFMPYQSVIKFPFTRSGEVTTTQMTERAGVQNGIPARFYDDVRLRACATLFYSTASFVTVSVLHL